MALRLRSFSSCHRWLASHLSSYFAYAGSDTLTIGVEWRWYWYENIPHWLFSCGLVSWFHSRFAPSRLFPQLIHKTSCPYTPQQNGVAKRKHRHITLAALLLCNTLLSRFLLGWNICKCGLSHQSLRASSSSLSPFTQLFHKDPNLRILRQPHLRPYIDHKLQPRSMPCIFLGYAPQQKGYRCLHIPTNRIWISRHVVFDENRFPFRELSTSGLTIPESTIEPALAPLRAR